ncbi:hypothetical protein [Actinomycetospora corticicola]|uniref:ABC-type transport system involved in cytochrome bd biosynthesis fused ATPase/permease subunit n=1 Tax=Actinomycetospora corticicola TaxID=663602 RepID=A0A7Y9DTN7_9PSEU|nr:hypothetical protein [Actinomycetospora corticicola]NYD35209.1 ABC-type transport system involved in cytochrome bd biosynthesis fused ATPase/permease subunit [Actinomycetospora corticicola]
MAPSTVRALLPTVSTVLVVAVGAAATRAVHGGVPALLVLGVVLGVALILVAVAAVATRSGRATRRRDDLDAEWAAVAPRWAGWDSPR